MDAVLRSASTQLLSRPDDEHHTLESFRSAALRDQQCGREVRVNARSVLFSEDPVARGGVALDVGQGRALPMTHFALGQACSLAGTSPSFLQRVLPPTRARILNEALNRDDLTDRVALVHDGSSSLIRAMTSTSYRRLWDLEILGNIEQWLLPQGWIPAVPTFRTNANRDNINGNNKPALFRGDRDSFTFFYSPESERPDLGGLRRGIVIYNSEVGARSFGFDTFLFRDVCANFLIWGAEQVQRKRARHVGRVSSLFSDFKLMLQRYSQELDSDTMRRLDIAARSMFAETDGKGLARENAATRLARQYKATQARANAIAEAATLSINQRDGSDSPFAVGRTDSLDYFAIANGASWLAHEEKNADEKMALAVLAGDVLADAGA